MAKTAKTGARETTIQAAPDAKGTKTAGTKKTSAKAAKPKAPKTKPKTAGTKKTSAKAAKPKAARSRSAKPKKRPRDEPLGDVGIVVVDDDLSIDREKINEERRAYLEEARSQEAFD